MAKIINSIEFPATMNDLREFVNSLDHVDGETKVHGYDMPGPGSPFRIGTPKMRIEVQYEHKVNHQAHDMTVLPGGGLHWTIHAPGEGGESAAASLVDDVIEEEEQARERWNRSSPWSRKPHQETREERRKRLEREFNADDSV